MINQIKAFRDNWRVFWFACLYKTYTKSDCRAEDTSKSTKKGKKVKPVTEGMTKGEEDRNTVLCGALSCYFQDKYTFFVNKIL